MILADDVWDEDSAYVEMLANEGQRLREKSEKAAAAGGNEAQHEQHEHPSPRVDPMGSDLEDLEGMLSDGLADLDLNNDNDVPEELDLYLEDDEVDGEIRNGIFPHRYEYPFHNELEIASVADYGVSDIEDGGEVDGALLEAKEDGGERRAGEGADQGLGRLDAGNANGAAVSFILARLSSSF